jgi:hypothetical protein
MAGTSYKPEPEAGKLTDLIAQTPEDLSQIFGFYANTIEDMTFANKTYKLRIYVEEETGEDSE